MSTLILSGFLSPIRQRTNKHDQVVYSVSVIPLEYPHVPIILSVPDELYSEVENFTGKNVKTTSAARFIRMSNGNSFWVFDLETIEEFKNK